MYGAFVHNDDVYDNFRSSIFPEEFSNHLAFACFSCSASTVNGRVFAKATLSSYTSGCTRDPRFLPRACIVKSKEEVSRNNAEILYSYSCTQESRRLVGKVEARSNYLKTFRERGLAKAKIIILFFFFQFCAVMRTVCVNIQFDIMFYQITRCKFTMSRKCKFSNHTSDRRDCLSRSEPVIRK